jgi:hypothetical protein
MRLKMREPERISRILKLIEKNWVQYPDLRLGQLLYAVGGSELENNLYYFEDDKIERMLNCFIYHGAKMPEIERCNLCEMRFKCWTEREGEE